MAATSYVATTAVTTTTVIRTETTEVNAMTTAATAEAVSLQAWFIAVICLIVLVPFTLCFSICLWRLFQRYSCTQEIIMKMQKGTKLGDTYDIEKITTKTGSTVCYLIIIADTNKLS